MFRLLGWLYGNTSWMIAKEQDYWDNLDRLDRIEFYLDDCVLCDTMQLIFLLKAGMFLVIHWERVFNLTFHKWYFWQSKILCCWCVTGLTIKNMPLWTCHATLNLSFRNKLNFETGGIKFLYYANCDAWNVSKHNGKFLKNNYCEPKDMVRLKKKISFGGNTQSMFRAWKNLNWASSSKNFACPGQVLLDLVNDFVVVWLVWTLKITCPARKSSFAWTTWQDFFRALYVDTLKLWFKKLQLLLLLASSWSTVYKVHFTYIKVQHNTFS